MDEDILSQVKRKFVVNLADKSASTALKLLAEFNKNAGKSIGDMVSDGAVDLILERFVIQGKRLVKTDILDLISNNTDIIQLFDKVDASFVKWESNVREVLPKYGINTSLHNAGKTLIGDLKNIIDEIVVDPDKSEISYFDNSKRFSGRKWIKYGKDILSQLRRKNRE